MSRPSNRRRLGLLALLLAFPLLALPLAGAPASAAGVVNVTIRVPANVVNDDPCVPGDQIVLSGTIHIVISSTADRAGGFRTINTLNSHLSGVSLVTGTRYVSNETSTDVWYARSPFPAVQTTSDNLRLVSGGRTPNYTLHTTIHTTVTADGVATAEVTGYRIDCQGSTATG